MQPMHSVLQQTKVTLVFQAKSLGVQCGADLELATWLPLLSVLCRKDGYVVAVVRGTSDEAAFSRLRAGYDSGAPKLLKAFDALAEKHLRVHAGQQQPTQASALYVHLLRVSEPCSAAKKSWECVALGEECQHESRLGRQQKPLRLLMLLVLRCLNANRLPSLEAVATQVIYRSPIWA